MTTRMPPPKKEESDDSLESSLSKGGPRYPFTPLPLLPSGPGGVHSLNVTRDHKTVTQLVVGLAEREGFEPSVRCRTHDFQSCTFGHSVTAPISWCGDLARSQTEVADGEGFEPPVLSYI
jgi:hypothetical protein